MWPLMENKREEHILKRRNVPHIESTDSEDSEKPVTQSVETIVQNAASDQPALQLSAVQAARLVPYSAPMHIVALLYCCYA